VDRKEAEISKIENPRILKNYEINIKKFRDFEDKIKNRDL